MEVGVTSTAFIPECRDKRATDCGTFLEIHKPGDKTILTEVKLQGQYVSGYKMAVISMNFMRDNDRILCEGPHEVCTCSCNLRLYKNAAYSAAALVGAPYQVVMDRGEAA